MAQLTYATEIDIDGPWLLDADSLTALDRILDEEWERLVLLEPDLIKQRAIEATGDDAPSDEALEFVRNEVGLRRERKVILTLADDSKLQVETFAEALRHHELMRSSVKSFELKLVYADIELTVEIDDGRRDGLEIEVEPEGVEETRELFMAVLDWARTHESPRWLQFWSRSYLAVLLMFVSWLGYIWWSLHLISESSRNALRMQAHTLLAHHITTQPARDKAMELLLAFNSGDYEFTLRNLTTIDIVILTVGGLFCIMVVFRPPNIIGIGRQAVQLKRWRRWIRFVSITLPTLIFSNIVLPPLRSFFLGLWR